MDASNTPDPDYVYDDDIKVDFNNQSKKLTRKNRGWSTLMGNGQNN